eukprot:831381_1
MDQSSWFFARNPMDLNKFCCEYANTYIRIINPSSITPKTARNGLLNEIQPQIYCLCGRGQQSSLKILRYGVCVMRLGTQNLSQFPFQIARVWTVSTSIAQSQTSLIV